MKGEQIPRMSIPEEVPAELRYLDEVHDFENGIDRGPIAGKKVLIYSPSKAGTVSLYHGLGSYFQAIEGWDSYVPKLLHNHSNRELISCLGGAYRTPGNVNESARNIVSDLIELQRWTAGRVRIVSSFRDPIRRAFSALYDALHNRIIRDREISLRDVTVELCQEMIERILRYQNTSRHPLEDIDPIFFERCSFDHRELCAIDRSAYYEILVVTIEGAAQWPRIMQLAFGRGGAMFQHKNRAADKAIASHCKPLIDNLRLPRGLVEQAYYSGLGGRYVAWHYPESVVEELCKKALISLAGCRDQWT